jgi:hypothetical protein
MMPQTRQHEYPRNRGSRPWHKKRDPVMPGDSKWKGSELPAFDYPHPHADYTKCYSCRSQDDVTIVSRPSGRGFSPVAYALCTKCRAECDAPLADYSNGGTLLAMAICHKGRTMELDGDVIHELVAQEPMPESSGT